MFSFCVIVIACIMIALISVFVKGVQNKDTVKAYSNLIKTRIDKS